MKAVYDIADGLPSCLRRDDPVIKALLSDGEGGGAFMRERAAFLKFAHLHTREADIRRHGGGTLDAIAGLFAGVQRLLEEPDAVFLRRFLALTEHKGESPWGTARDIKNVFETFFSGARCEVLENTGEAALPAEALLESGEGLFYEGGSCASVTLEPAAPPEAGWHALHFFLKGGCAAEVTDGAGRRFDSAEQVWESPSPLSWGAGPAKRVFRNAGEGWQARRVLAKAEKTGPLKFRLEGAGGGRVARARLYAVPPHPSYTLLFIHNGYGGNEDAGRVFTHDVSFFDSAYMTGITGVALGDMISEVLEAVRVQGAKVFLDFSGGIEEGEGDAV